MRARKYARSDWRVCVPGMNNPQAGIPRALIDTNVWISAILNPSGQPARILAAFRQGQFVAVLSRPLVEEIANVLYRPRIYRRWQFDVTGVQQTLYLLSQAVFEPAPAGTLHICRDPKDDFVLETALLGNAQYVVSRDEDITRDPQITAFLREHGIEVLTVGHFLALLESPPTRP